MNHPLKGEPLTVLVMPKLIVPERMFGVNDPTLNLDTVIRIYYCSIEVDGCDRLGEMSSYGRKHCIGFFFIHCQYHFFTDVFM